MIERVQHVGRRVMAAQPREMVVGNIVRRVLGLIRDEAEDDREADFTLSEAGSESQPQTPRALDGQSCFITHRTRIMQKLTHSAVCRPLRGSLFSP